MQRYNSMPAMYAFVPINLQWVISALHKHSMGFLHIETNDCQAGFWAPPTIMQDIYQSHPA